MVKQILIIGFLSLVAFHSDAHDSARVEQLEKELQEIKIRLSKLESVASNAGNAQQLVPSADGWKAVVNWRKLTKGMSTADVRTILGEPERIDGGTIERWSYQNRGRLVFYDGKVDSWTEPRQ
jgi:hypothetical protein